ncbi:MAG: glycosyltransferase family 39 protein [Anaerolineales bacterium]|nr:glycosyltransferase family 39 protein [Anaerolineales bacterium]
MRHVQLIFSRQSRWFWGALATLLFLYSWTLTAASTITVRVTGEQCAAQMSGYELMVPCSGEFREVVVLAIPAGLFYTPPPLSRLLGHTQLSQLRLQSADGLHTMPLRSEGWRSLAERLSEAPPVTKLTVDAPAQSDFSVDLRIRRPEGVAGILLLDENETGLAFIVDVSGRRGVWWMWQDGELGDPIQGGPWQRSLTAQLQSFVLRLISPAFTAVLLLLAGQLLAPHLPARSWTGRRLPDTVLVAAATFTVFAVALHVATRQLEYIPHVQDSVTNLFQAQTLARGQLWAPPPGRPEFFVQEFLTVYQGKWFGQYLPGFPLLLVPGVWLETPWLINPLLGALTVPLLFVLARDWGGASLARWAVVLLVSSPFFLIMSGTMMVHAAELFWAILFLLAWRRYWRCDGWRWGVVSALALGMAALTRPVTVVALLLPYALLVWLSQAPWLREQGRWQHWLFRAAGPAFLALPLLLLIPFYQYQLTGDPWLDPRLIARPFDTLGFGPDRGEGPNVFTLRPLPGMTATGLGQLFSLNWAVSWEMAENLPPRGHNLARGLYNVGQNWRALEAHLYGWYPWLTFALVWVGLLRRRPGWRELMLVAPVLALFAVYTTYWTTGQMYGPRYFYMLIPPLLLLTAYGIRTLVQAWGPAGRPLVYAGLLLLLARNLLVYLPLALAETQDFNFVDGDLQRTVVAEVDRPALVFVAGEPLEWWHYGSFFSGNTPWLDGEIIYARDLGDAQNRQLMADYPDYQPYRFDGVLRRYEMP